jgi:hypothetical protein
VELNRYGLKLILALVITTTRFTIDARDAHVIRSYDLSETYTKTDICPENIQNEYETTSCYEKNSVAPINDFTNSPLSQLFRELDGIEVVSHPEGLTRIARHKKKWTIMVYMAADNDLAPFARRNLVQLSSIGSNSGLNILCHLDARMNGKKQTKRYFIEKNKMHQENVDDHRTDHMDSGNPETLIDFCLWAIQKFPAEHYMLVLWNHGTGVIDIGRPRTMNPSELFTFNPKNNLLEIDRTLPFLDFIQEEEKKGLRGICFDDSTGHYLSNQDLEYALKIISQKGLAHKKIDIIAFDACLMAMIEISNIIKEYADYMVASQELELGTGYNYTTVLSPLENGTVTKKEFAQHIVDAYHTTYMKITEDYTQAALDLSIIPKLEKNIDEIASLLIECLKTQKNNTVKEAVRTSRHKLLCTHFDEPSYLDAHHLLLNLQSNIKHFTFTNSHHGSTLISLLYEKIQEGLKTIKQAVIANTSGKNLKQASGLAIYFPERRIHNSYHKTKFATSNRWYQFLKYFLES